METSNIVKECARRILMSRMRILLRNAFYGLLLMHINFGLDDSQPTAYTNGDKICFSTNFLSDISDSELDFVLMHEIMHIVLRHCTRGDNFNKLRYNIAADIVVNSNILKSLGGNVKTITLKKFGESMHLTPDKEEGYNYTTEEVYNMLDSKDKMKNYIGDGPEEFDSFDNHQKWPGGADENTSFNDDVWVKRIEDAVEAVKNMQGSSGCGGIPNCIEKILEERGKPQVDWRSVINAVISEEIEDYSFCPPDRRYSGDFFLPDFNEKGEEVRNVLFMIDTSASMTDIEICEMYTEIKSCIDQFDGKLKGYLGFFDSEVVEPKPFEGDDEFKLIKAYGGGGTSFNVIFNYVKQRMEGDVSTLIILTDGFAPFPPKEYVPSCKLLWVINNGVIKPPYGTTVRIKSGLIEKN